MTDSVIVAWVVAAFGIGAIGGALVVYGLTQRTRSQIAVERLRAREECAAELDRARAEGLAELWRAREEGVAELQRARNQIAAERQRALEEQDVVVGQIKRGRAELASVEAQLAGVAREYRSRFAECERATHAVCTDLEQGLSVFVSILTRTPSTDVDVISQVYRVNDRWVKIKNSLLDIRRLFEAGIVGSGAGEQSGRMRNGPQGHLSAQWHD